VDGEGGGAGAAVDAADGDDEAARAGSGAGLAGGGHPGELAGQVGGPIRPGQQAAGAGDERRLDVGRVVVVADGDQRDRAVRRQVGEGGAGDQGDRRAGGDGGGQAGGAGIGQEGLPAGGLDGVPQGIGGAGVVVGDDDHRRDRRDGFEGHGHPPGAWNVGSADRGDGPRRSGAGKDGRAPDPVEDAPARMCITSAHARQDPAGVDGRFRELPR
jgi:hypothetical protein